MLIDFKRLLLPGFVAALILTGCQQDLNGQPLETNTPASPTITVTLSEPTESPTAESADEELGEDVVLTLWHPFSGRLGGVFENLVDEFNRDNDPKITIKIESHADVDVLSEDIEEAHVSGGQLPHMVIAPKPYVENMASIRFTCTK